MYIILSVTFVIFLIKLTYILERFWLISVLIIIIVTIIIVLIITITINVTITIDSR
jgi:hypothetical protein